MARLADPSCPVEETPCLRVLDDLLIELARIRAREEGRASGPCRRCGERGGIPLAGEAVCYRCRLGRSEEDDHPRGSGSGPAILTLDSNTHRVLNEAERVWHLIVHSDLCGGCAAGFPMRLGAILARLEGAA